MIKCKDCRYKTKRLKCMTIADYCGFREVQIRDEEVESCIHAERADGLKECCDTCKDYIVDDWGDPKCLKERFLINESAESFVDGSKVKCDEWEFINEKK